MVVTARPRDKRLVYVVQQRCWPQQRTLLTGAAVEVTEEERDGLDTALNEAELLGVEIDPVRRCAAATLRVLSLPAEGPSPEDARVSSNVELS